MRPSLGNREAEFVIGRMETALRQGDDFLAPLDHSKLFPKILARMLRVGNETGNLTTSVQQITDILEEKFDQVVDRTLTLLEPAIILTLSMIVALIIVSLMSAIISINELAEMTARLMQFDLKIEYTKPRPQEVELANCSADKARRRVTLCR